jgi:iron complex transport system ATP-binding protein
VSNHGLSESDFTSLKNGEFPLPCLLLDEPCASLDLEFQQRIQHYLQQLCGIGLTVILVTHDLNSALYYSNRVLLMSAGEVVAFDVPERVLTPENILDVFHIHADITIHKNRRLLIF